MSSFGDIMKALRDVLVLTERVDRIATMAEDAHRTALANRERIVRVETILEFAMQRGSPPPSPAQPAPPQLPPQ